MIDSEDIEPIVRDFVAESREGLQQFELTLLELESAPDQQTLLIPLFRMIHSIKGSCGFLELPTLESLTHAGESLLARARDNQLRIGREASRALLVMVDRIRELLSHIEAHRSEPEIDLSDVIGLLERATAGAPSPSADDAGSASTSDDTLALFAGSVGDGKLRVDVGLLDKLMNLMGELVLARNQIIQLSMAQASSGMVASSQRLSLVTTELQEAVMKTRMQPIANVWVRFPRIVRDIAGNSGKRVRLVSDGRETELDKTIIEAIHDPLIHIVRNAVDHGIESPEIRIEAGKPAEGTLRLRAFHEGGMVNIEISDDGAGMDPAALKQKAVSLGLIQTDQATRMTDRDALALVFLPGLTTASRVTNVSGRGVGMDIVKTNVEKIGGNVDIQSRLGFGTTIRIKIPLTLAIIPALILDAGGQRYAIPQASLLEVVRLEEEESAHEIVLVQGAPVLKLRGKLLPLAYLDRELGLPCDRPRRDSVVIVVLQADDHTFGLVVEEIRDTEEIVVKPLWQRLKGLTCYAGATIMGDGRVALILDAMGLAQRLGVVTESQETKLARREEEALGRADGRELVVLCRIDGDARLAIPLSKVARLEELPVQRIEHVGPSDVVQYRGRILPLIHVARVLSGGASAHERERTLDPTETLKVVVYSREDRSVGLVVENILDIVEVELALERPAIREGVLGSMTVQERITEFLDVENVIRSVDPSFLAGSASAQG